MVKAKRGQTQLIAFHKQGLTPFFSGFGLSSCFFANSSVYYLLDDNSLE